MNAPSTLPHVDAARPPASRVRLPPEVRINQILDAALVEFSAKGFNATRIEDIAKRAGLSKGGLYAHFESKDAVFEALLNRTLAPPHIDVDGLLNTSANAAELVHQFVDLMYRDLTNTAAIATLRLLIAESERVPHLVALWQRNAMEAHIGRVRDVFIRSVDKGLCRACMITKEPWMAISPLVHIVMSELIFGSAAGIESEHMKSLDEARQDHIDLLCELLTP
jgi:AcrR family transcriptional regulator